MIGSPEIFPKSDWFLVITVSEFSRQVAAITASGSESMGLSNEYGTVGNNIVKLQYLNP
jgi:hypothetical protein